MTLTWQPRPARPPHLDERAIHIWRVSIASADASTALLDASNRLLSPDERTRAARFHTAALRHAFVLCRGAVRTILELYTGCPAAAIVFEYGEHGKPAARANDGRDMPQFNVSHSGDLALVALARDVPVGVDVERTRALPDADRIAERFFSPEECARYRTLPAAAKADGFFRCWTRKEAFIKALGEGLSRPLHTFDVSLEPGAPASILRIAGAEGEERGWSLCGFAPAPGYMGAVAAPLAGAVLTGFDIAAAGAPRVFLSP